MTVTKVLVHPKFNRRHLTNDIALMWVRTSYNQTVQYRDHILPICLPDINERSETYYLSGIKGTVSGWGLLEETARKGSNTLQFVTLPVLTHDMCENAYGRFVDISSELQFCAGNSDGQDACAGDSGGPFVILSDGKYTLTGVVSYGRGCARAEYPGVYTKVHHYLKWIFNSVSSQDQSTEPTKVDQTTTASTSTTTQSTTSTTTTTTTTTTVKPSTDLSSGEFCSKDFRALRCPSPKKIKVTFATFAADTNGVCQSSTRAAAAIVVVDCALRNAILIPKHRCNGRSKCWIYHGLFHHDPCPGVQKFAKVDYVCV